MNIGHLLSGSRIIATACTTMTQSLAALALLLIAHSADAQTTLPSDVKPTCTVPSADFNNWFATGSVSKDGIVLPAGSLTFTPNSACSFYKWSEQMFLWLTSPLGSGRHVFSSPAFYGVDAPGSDKMRNPVPQDDNKLLSFAPAVALVGKEGMKVVSDSTGKIRNVVRVPAGLNSSLLFQDKADKPVDIARVAAAANGKPLLLDRTNKVVDVKAAKNGAPLLRDAAGKMINLAPSTVLVDGVQHLLTTSGDVVEFGQAGGNDVIMTQNNGLVYYLIQVNDVFAYFRTGMADGKFPAPPPAQFPVGPPLLDNITDIAKSAPPPNTKTSFPDRVALAMELKSSWVEVSKVANPQDYLTIKATIPNFVPSGADRLVQSGTKDVDLALVGFHVVGSTLGHPEMIWATFEHVNNTPSLQYTYTNASGTTVTKPADSAGPWLFSTSGASAATLQSRMRVDPANNQAIVAINAPPTIGPIDVTRQNPWGSLPADSTVTQKNTDVISINQSVLGQMAAADIRKNYIMIGATWTKDGKLPIKSNEAGTTTLANSTMETFMQRLNCFGCHTGLATDPNAMLGDSNGGGLSHIWGKIKPLFP
jgi:hypothetical protein